MAPEAPKAKSFANILQQNQEFITHLEALQADIGAQLEEKEVRASREPPHSAASTGRHEHKGYKIMLQE